MQTYRFDKNLYASAACPRTRAALFCENGALVAALHYKGAFGMGEKFDSLNQKGKTVVCKVEEKFCFQGEKTYCPAPFFWTDTGFGLYVDTCEGTTFSFQEGCVCVSLPQGARLCVFSGEPRAIVSEYMQLFGKAVLPPDWAFGAWISANHWKSRKDALLQAENLRRYDFPASVIVFEAWSDEATFYIFNGAKYTPVQDGGAPKYEDFDFSDSPWPDPKGMIERLHEAGLRVVLWQIPVYKKQDETEEQNAQNDLDWEDAAKRGLCVHLSDQTPYRIPEGHWFAGSMLPDFTNPETVKTWFDKRRYLLEIGVDGFKTDGGEFIYTDDAAFYDGSTGRQGVNRYARDYTQAYRDFIGEERVLFSRAGYAGQHTVPIHWAGDQQSQNSELSAALTAGLSLAATGVPFWGFDIAGFAGPLPSLDLYRRATQLACFCPIMQWHSEPDGGQFRALMAGGEGDNERSPWNMAAAYHAPTFLDEMRFWHKLRYRLLPYILRTARQCAAQSLPMMRPLGYAFPQDENAVFTDDAYLFGDALLVFPLLDENAESRRVYLPQGNWRGLFDGESYAGEQVFCAGGNGALPVFVNLGAPAASLDLLSDVLTFIESAR